MKILFISMFAPHFFNWASLLKDSNHDVFWLDVYDSNTSVPQLSFAEQIVGWRYKWDYPGRYFLKRHTPKLTNLINKFNEEDLNVVLERKIVEIRPDVIHSFVLFIAGFPILNTMRKYPNIKWIYSAWGSDMFFLLSSIQHLQQGKLVLPHFDYMFADCERDHQIALKYGFEGEFLGVYPGGGGISLQETDEMMLPMCDRRLILIKGYQGELGCSIEVLKALEALKWKFENFEIVVFGAHPEVLDYISSSAINKWKSFRVLGNLAHYEVLKLMGEALVYIGNSISDGMPNTLLEAIGMGAYPIQSNPGGATAEKIKDGFNGLLIEKAQDVQHIREVLERIDFDQLSVGIKYNLEVLKPSLDRKVVKAAVLHEYQRVEQQLNCQNKR